MTWFTSGTAHILFIHIPFVVKPVPIFMARNKISKSCLMAELCFHRFVHFDCALIYIFGFHRKQYASDLKDFAFVKLTSQLFSSADESLKRQPPPLPPLSYVSIVLWMLIVFQYTFSAFTTSNALAIRTTSLLWSSRLSISNESLKDETRLLLLWHGSLVTLYTFSSYIYTICGEASAHLYREQPSY